MKSRIALFISLLLPLAVQAEVPLKFHLTGQATITQIKADEVSFSPKLFHIKAGAVLTDSVLDGIGLEVMAGVPMSDATKHELTLDIKEQQGAYLTLQDPDAAADAIKFIAFIGYASTRLETRSAFTGITAESTFNGTSYGFAFQQRLFAEKAFSWKLDCTRFFRDKDARIDGCGLGVSYDF